MNRSLLRRVELLEEKEGVRGRVVVFVWKPEGVTVSEALARRFGPAGAPAHARVFVVQWQEEEPS